MDEPIVTFCAEVGREVLAPLYVKEVNEQYLEYRKTCPIVDNICVHRSYDDI
ncbi:hypothetical protein OnM2_044039, partial [Erysiphe neolycopersici]